MSRFPAYRPAFQRLARLGPVAGRHLATCNVLAFSRSTCACQVGWLSLGVQ